MSISDDLKPKPDQITIKRQAVAASPEVSAWVSANAGSGKTYVLSTRVIRLLLTNVDPAKILCLTYTKTAAAEMKNRVFSRLGAWTTMADADLAKELIAITNKNCTDAEIRFARTLFAKALETPGGLKIQTIHAFCEALLHRFPLEANIAGHFELIDDVEADLLMAEARRKLLTELGDGAVLNVLERSGETGFEELLSEIVNNRQKLINLIDNLGVQSEWRRVYLSANGFDPECTVEDLKLKAWPLPGLTQEYCRDTFSVIPSSGAKTARDLLEKLTTWYGDERMCPSFDELCELLLTKKNEIRATKNYASAKAAAVAPDLEARFIEAAQHAQLLVFQINLLDEIERTMDALSVADRLLSLYGNLKRRRGLLDFDDLIERTELMLLKENVADWVRYKLDQGIDHILVDEAQDTSPPQWRVIKILADEFFAGESSSSSKRTVFAVGDEKQSIYSFQGADPKGFDDARSHFAVKIDAADRKFKPVDLEASFRSTGDILDAVDHVFSYADHKRGLAAHGGDVQKHRSLRENQPGSVEIWDFERAEKQEQEEDWRKPFDFAAQPAIIVASRIADRIKSWLDGGTCLEATGQKIKAGDVLVLVRKRDAFVHALSRALKERHIPVAGADRLGMTSHIAVLDLMALGRVMINQNDDLSLAALLRSPMFGLSDDDLFELSYDRESTLFETMALYAHEDEGISQIVSLLKRWIKLAVQKPVFEFYSHVLVSEGMRSKLIARLGSETGEMLDEFLNYALAQERTGPASLETFLNTLEHFSPEIKREMEGESDQVRIMTVHGAKGLEAPIVFLIDPGSPAYGSHSTPVLLPYDLKTGLAHPVKGVLVGGAGAAQSAVSKEIIQGLKQSAEEEYRRLLYVGMTRAADQLIVAGYAGQNGGKEGTWLSMVKTALEPLSKVVPYADFEALRYPENQTLPPYPEQISSNDETSRALTVPACFDTPVPKEPPAPRPLIPSGVTGFSVEADRQESEAEQPVSLLADYQAQGEKLAMPPDLAAKRGSVIHKLLQYLPDIPSDERAEKAGQFCWQIETRWSDTDIDLIVSQTLRVIDDEAYAPFFSDRGTAEVSVMGTVDIGGEKHPVSGVIDRLTVVGDEVYIIDYKTNANPPSTLAEIPLIYLRQMALYHALVAPLYPQKQVKAALLFTSTPQLIEIDNDLLAKTLDNMAADNTFN
jgi:ATP-dependent helicase/nuclease subunit A